MDEVGKRFLQTIKEPAVCKYRMELGVFQRAGGLKSAWNGRLKPGVYSECSEPQKPQSRGRKVMLTYT